MLNKILTVIYFLFAHGVIAQELVGDGPSNVDLCFARITALRLLLLDDGLGRSHPTIKRFDVALECLSRARGPEAKDLVIDKAKLDGDRKIELRKVMEKLESVRILMVNKKEMEKASTLEAALGMLTAIHLQNGIASGTHDARSGRIEIYGTQFEAIAAFITVTDGDLTYHRDAINKLFSILIEPEVRIHIIALHPTKDGIIVVIETKAFANFS